MKDSVMQGQIMFSMSQDDRVQKANATFNKFASIMDKEPKFYNKVDLREVVEALLGTDAPVLIPEKVDRQAQIADILSNYDESYIRHTITAIANDRRDWDVDDDTLFAMRIFQTKREADMASYAGQMYAAERNGECIVLRLFNQGEAIPEYALERLTERFYSLPRPNGGRKSTGLGLNFVLEVAELHGGELRIGNVESGVEVRLTLPA
jgi:nitrogen fixation/metabolism regulation signal transduction histidine kinase